MFRKITKKASAPTKQTSGSAGHDISSAYSYTIKPNNRQLVLTDIAIKIPEGYYARLAPRSGLAYKYGIDIGGGVIDIDFTGNIGVLIFNLGSKPFIIQPGDRIAQLILERIYTEPLMETDDCTRTTERGACGFGSTGLK